MVPLNLISWRAVRDAVAEYDQLGRDVFLGKYGFAKARHYFLLVKGKRYDSKAIVGVAHRYEDPEGVPLLPSQFSGGEHSASRVLRKLGFTVVKGTPRTEPDALVLVENEATVGGAYDFWADDTGVRYQFPNQYRNLVRPGIPFVYYRGVRRAGGLRGTPEYFGSGLIGEVWPDPSQTPATTLARNRRWYCAIEEYAPFQTPVASKTGGVSHEKIAVSMGWRTGVRKISASVFDGILSAALASPPTPAPPTADALDVQVHESQPSELLVIRPKSVGVGSARVNRPSSRRLKEIGDWAEEVVYRWLCETLPVSERETVDWVASRGETPGWDISYVSASGAPIHVEVKGTTQSRFALIEVSGNEWRAAQLHGERFVLALVCRATSQQPRIALIRNPWAGVGNGDLSVEPSSWRLTARAPDA